MEEQVQQETRNQPSGLEVIGAVLTVGVLDFLVWNWSRFRS